MKKILISVSLLLALGVIFLIVFWPRLVPQELVVEPPLVKPLVVEPRRGAWLDEIIAIVADHEIAVPMIEAGELHIFADDIACPEVFREVVASPYMEYEQLFGVSIELTLNPAGTPEEPFFHDGRLNPFAIPRIREAMNWLIDRTYIAEELWGGMAIPRYLPLHPAFPDYARFIDVARRLELYYAHNPAQAEVIITEEMKKLGAERINGTWYWKGEPVEIIVLSRVEDTRLHLGHYVTRLLEDLGFKTRHLMKTAAEAAPIWMHADPYQGLSHIYTGGWIDTVISRDQGGAFNFFYTPRGMPTPLWLATKPAPEFCELANRLAIRDYQCLKERAALFERTLELALQDSHRIWVVNTIGFMPRRAEISLAADLAGGIAGAFLWALTSHFECPVTGEIEVGGTATVAMPSILPDPWNPLAGSNWIFDMMFIRATGDWGTIPDPFTGLAHPQRIERAQVYVREGLPVGVTLGWVDLEFVPEAMEVPDDAWVDWDALEQRFITLEEASARPDFDPERRTAEVRVRVYYPANLFDTVKWHDGSPLDLADFVMGMILGFDRPNPDSPIFDEAEVPGFTTFMKHFRGVRIVSEDPLIIESYTNMALLDAEAIAAGWTWFPYYGQGPGAWHNLTPAILAEKNKELAFSTARAGDLEVEWMSFIAGPSLPILEERLNYARASGFLPYAPTLSEFITLEETTIRYLNLQHWLEEKGHFWIGTGPFYLEAVHPIEMIVHLRRFPYFPDRAEKWVGFVEPRIAAVEVAGPAKVIAGEEAIFAIEVTFEAQPYPVADVYLATYLLIDARGEIIHIGEAIDIRDGRWQVIIPGEKTAALTVGSTRLEVVISPTVVAIPSFASLTFVLFPKK